MEDRERNRRAEKEERMEKERKERERKKKQDRRWRRRRNVMWKEVEGEDREERRVLVEMYIEKELEREAVVREIAEIRGEDGRMLVIMEMENEEDRKELLEMGRVLWRRWKIGVEEDLTLEERRIRWRMERARIERVRHAVVSGRRMWIKGK